MIDKTAAHYHGWLPSTWAALGDEVIPRALSHFRGKHRDSGSNEAVRCKSSAKKCTRQEKQSNFSRSRLVRSWAGSGGRLAAKCSSVARTHDDHAAAKARAKVEERRRKRDGEGADFWLRIVVAIGQLSKPPRRHSHCALRGWPVTPMFRFSRTASAAPSSRPDPLPELVIPS